jgi:hypothetical protein
MGSNNRSNLHAGRGKGVTIGGTQFGLVTGTFLLIMLSQMMSSARLQYTIMNGTKFIVPYMSRLVILHDSRESGLFEQKCAKYLPFEQ